MPEFSEVGFLERRLKINSKLATSYLFYATLYRKGRIMLNKHIFFYNDCSIRVVVDNSGELLFRLIDICKALNWNIENTSNIANKIKAEFNLSTLPIYKFDTHYGVRDCFMVTKAHIYFILARLRKRAKAKEFRLWFDNELLPNIKKIENHSLEQDSPIPKSYGELLLEAGRLALENEKLLAKIKEKENQSKIEAEAETKIILKCEFLGNEISQKSENGYLSATDLFKVANQLRAKKGLNPRAVDTYNHLKSTIEFEAQLAKKYITREHKYGRGQHLWIHPLLFIDMALWLFNPDFKLEVYEWIFNDLPKYIDNSYKGE